MHYAYDANGQLLVNNGLGWAPANAGAPANPQTCGGVGQAAPAAQTGGAFLPIAMLLGGIWVVSALLAR